MSKNILERLDSLSAGDADLVWDTAREKHEQGMSTHDSFAHALDLLDRTVRKYGNPDDRPDEGYCQTHDLFASRFGGTCPFC